MFRKVTSTLLNCYLKAMRTSLKLLTNFKEFAKVENDEQNKIFTGCRSTLRFSLNSIYPHFIYKQPNAKSLLIRKTQTIVRNSVKARNVTYQY